MRKIQVTTIILSIAVLLAFSPFATDAAIQEKQNSETIPAAGQEEEAGVDTESAGEETPVDEEEAGVDTESAGEETPVDEEEAGVDAESAGEETPVGEEEVGVDTESAEEETPIDEEEAGVDAESAGEETPVDEEEAGVDTESAEEETPVDEEEADVDAESAEEEIPADLMLLLSLRQAKPSLPAYIAVLPWGYYSVHYDHACRLVTFQYEERLFESQRYMEGKGQCNPHVYTIRFTYDEMESAIDAAGIGGALLSLTIKGAPIGVPVAVGSAFLKIVGQVLKHTAAQNVGARYILREETMVVTGDCSLATATSGKDFVPYTVVFRW